MSRAITLRSSIVLVRNQIHVPITVRTVPAGSLARSLRMADSESGGWPDAKPADGGLRRWVPIRADRHNA
jgi:hypothetical protein